MSNRLVARAPGKLFLLGEYAVLDGCPAVLAAIDRHVEVRLQQESSGATVRLAAPGHATIQFRTAEPPVVDGPLRFAISAYRSALRRCPVLHQRALTIEIASRLGETTDGKLGLGSSAAVTVGIVAAILAAANANVSDLDRNVLFAVALEAHREAQDGVGSGADVAASVFGGLVLFRPRNGSPPLTAPLALPVDAILLAAWTGEAASTTDLVRRYLRASNGGAAARAAFVAASRSCVEAFVAALDRGSLSLPDMERNGTALERLADQLDLPVFTPRLQQLVTIARAHGAAAKISGAGGGDCGIAVTRDCASAQRIRTAWQRAGLVPLDINVSVQGVSVDHC